MASFFRFVMCAGLVLLVAFGASAHPLAQPAELPQLRRFDQEKLTQLQASKDFRYDEEPAVEQMSWWDEFVYWLWRKLAQLFTLDGAAGYFWYTVVALFVIFVVLILVVKDVGALFQSTKNMGGLNIRLEHENIHELDLDAAIRQAAEQANFKLATRYHYLKVLKLLNDKGHIVWGQGKTNREYVLELKSGQLSALLQRSVFLFEYVWYGDFAVAADRYSSIELSFNEAYAVINKK